MQRLSPWQLSQRQLQVLRGIAAGRTNKQIAADLKITQKTVECHCHIIHVTLGCHNAIECVGMALRIGLITVDDIGPGAPRYQITNIHLDFQKAVAHIIAELEEEEAARSKAVKRRLAQLKALLPVSAIVEATAMGENDFGYKKGIQDDKIQNDVRVQWNEASTSC